MENISAFTYVLFSLTALATVLFFLKALHFNRTAIIVLIVLSLLQGMLALKGFYADTSAVPPRMLFAVGPSLLLIIFLFASRSGKVLTAAADIRTLTLLHVIRIPVEISLFLLYTYKAVPQLITFEGLNFDIISGITAPVIYYLFFVKKILSAGFLIGWNILCLVLLFNVVIRAVLAVPYSFQQFAFDQPNIGVLYFPFIWLPAVIVPIVLCAHLISLSHLMRRSKASATDLLI